MKAKEMLAKAKDFSIKTVKKAGFAAKKHSPEILLGVGIAGTIAGTVMACRATLKAGAVLEEAKANLDKVHQAAETFTESNDEGEREKYTTEDAAKDKAIIFVQTGFKLAKLYAPAVIIGGFSLASIMTSHRILSQRNLALAAAYATVDKSFKEYRERVKIRFGEEVEREIRNNIKAIEIEETHIDDGSGKEVTEKKTVTTSEPGMYGRYFEAGNPYWDSESCANLTFLRMQQSYANDRLRANGVLFLNDVLDDLGFPKCKVGQQVGWVYDPENPKGDNYVDFGIAETYRSNGKGYIPTILLDFNVDGNIMNDVPEEGWM